MSEQELTELVDIAHTVASQDELITVCHKILRSVGKVLNVDRASLFVYSKDSLGNEKLISHLFDITERINILTENFVERNHPTTSNVTFFVSLKTKTMTR